MLYCVKISCNVFQCRCIVLYCIIIIYTILIYMPLPCYKQKNKSLSILHWAAQPMFVLEVEKQKEEEVDDVRGGVTLQ